MSSVGCGLLSCVLLVVANLVVPRVSRRKLRFLDTAERILRVAGFETAIDRVPEFRRVKSGRGRPFYVADALWRLPIAQALARTELPLSVNWSDLVLPRQIRSEWTSTVGRTTPQSGFER